MAGDVTIIGAGASGVLVALHLLRERFQGHITLIERAAQVGEGIAYSTRRAEHLLNVTAARMSVFDDDPGHFVRYLAARGDAHDPVGLAASFAQRRQYADYLRTTLETARTAAPNLDIVRDEALAIRHDGRCRLVLHSGAELAADVVVLALGNWPRAALRESALALRPGDVVPGWQFEAVAAIDPRHDVCIAGSGLSMVDTVLTLAAQAHAGAIHLVSRHGLLPLPHVAHGYIDVDLDAFAALSLAQRARHLRLLARAAQRRGEPWQWLMDTLRTHNVRWWQTLPETGQRRFLRHAARYWDVHRHRIPAVAAQTMEALRRGGQLQLHRGRISAVAAHASQLRVGVEQRARREDLRVDRLIDCTGLQTDIARVDEPLVTQLRDAGNIRRGAHGIGIATDAHGALIDAHGAVNPCLYTIGSVRIGQLWESVAVPELRQQAAALARRIVGMRDQSENT